MLVKHFSCRNLISSKAKGRPQSLDNKTSEYRIMTIKQNNGIRILRKKEKNKNIIRKEYTFNNKLKLNKLVTLV